MFTVFKKQSGYPPHFNLYNDPREFTVKDETITEWRFNYGKMIDEVRLG